jgi:NAD(P)-dependent dehydrogenase (short-subunit alcohol dehydrogenase family)/acyl carrier protein
VVRLGTGFRRVHDSCFEIGTDFASDVMRVLQAEPWSGAVLLPNAETDGAFAGVGGCELPLAMAQAILHAQTGTELWLVTQGSQAVSGERSIPAQAPISGFGLAVAYERPELHCSLIDLDAGGKSDAAEEIVNELLNGGEEVRVAWRSGERFVSRIERIRAPRGGRSALNAEATYLITGGLGSLGLKTAERMVRDGARHLVLTGRNISRAADVGALRHSGAKVTVAACDLSKAGDMDRLFRETIAGMPPLRGVVHCAGVLHDALLPQQTPESFRRVMAAKVAGAWDLHQRTQSHPLDFFLLYSSAASLIGSAGQANYAAANAFLDALAHYRRSRGLAATSINWGAWNGEGMAARSEIVERLAARGVETISAEDGLDLLSILFAGGETPAQLGVFPAEWTAFARHLPARLRLRFSSMAAPAASTAGTIAAQLQSAPAPEWNRILRGYLQQTLAAILGYKIAGDLNPQQRFFQLGMDSLAAVEFKNRLEEELHIPLPTTLVFDYPEIGSLAEFLANRVSAAMPGTRQTPAALGGNAHSREQEALNDLTKDKLAALLMKELGESAIDVQ